MKVNDEGEKGEICMSEVFDLVRWYRSQSIGGGIEGLIFDESRDV